MSGVAALRAVLVSDGALTALVPAARIITGPLPLNIETPAISLQGISGTDLNILSPGSTRFVTERVQVTVIASRYPEQRTILRAVRHAAADQINLDVGGVFGATIHTDGAGRDFFNEQASLYLGTQDFRIKYTETR